MKTVKFKKWIITAIVSFVITILLLIISVIVGGTSIFNSIDRMDSIMASSTMHKVADMMSLDEDLNVSLDFEYADGLGCDASISINEQEFSVYNTECNDINNDFENLIDTEVYKVVKETTITNKQQLDQALQAVNDFIITNNLSEDQVILEEVIDSVTDSIESKFDNTPVTKQMGNNEDFEDYFESKFLNGSDVDDYIETSVLTNIK